MKEMKNRIGFKIKCEMRFTSEFQRNKTGRENKEKETKEYTIQNNQIQVKRINGIQN